MSKRMITSLLLCALAFNAAPRDAVGVFAANGDDDASLDAPEGLREGIDDSSLEGNGDYQKWKKAFLQIEAGRGLWIKYSRGFRLNIRMGENSGGRSGVEATDYAFAGGRLIGATIVLGVEFAKNAPLNTAAYPILSSLTGSGVSREARAVAFLAHEFGHVENARKIGRNVLRQNQLLDRNEAGFIQYGRDWFNRPEYRQILSELGAEPADIMRRREIGAEASAIPVIQEYLGRKAPATVRQAIERYQKRLKASFAQSPFDLEKTALANTRRMLAQELDPELPKVPFANWVKQVIGPGAEAVWQLSECGETEAATNETGDLRACVEINTILPDSRRVIVMVSVGTFKKGIAGAPAYCGGVIEQGGNLHTIPRLRDLQKLLSAPGIWAISPIVNRPAIKLPELNIPKLAVAGAHMLGSPELSEAEHGDLTPYEDPPPDPPPPPDDVAPSKSPSPAEGRSASGRLIQGAAIHKEQPTYPPNAKRFNASGPVEVRVTISAEGRVKEAVTTSGHPLLREAAAEAARKWVFRPTTVNGVPVETQLVLTFDFSVLR